MTDSRSARTSAQVATQPEADARSARTSAQVATQPEADARVARTSVQVALAYEFPVYLGGGWGAVGIGV